MNYKAEFFVLIMVMAFACVDPYESDITPTYEQYPIATYLDMDSTHTQWVRLLEYTDLFNTMNLSDNYTSFVPSEEGISRYLKKEGINSVEDIPIDEAIYLVKYHTIRGTQYSQSLFDNGILPDSTATGDYLSIEIREGGLNAIYINGEARISQLDIEATNGIIHILEDVITPITKTIYEEVSSGGYALFAEALEITGYSSLLNSIKVTEANTETGIKHSRKLYFTLFAVSDETYSNFGINSLNDLAAYVGETNTDYTQGSNGLNKYVAYHFIEQQLDFESLATFSDETQSKNLQTMAANEMINISVHDESLAINFNKTDSTFTSIVNENINTKNGVIHGVNSPMPVAIPPVTTVTWELTDYAGVASVASDIYRKSTLSSTQSYIFKPGETSCYVWEAIPASQNDNSVAYKIANKNDAILFEMVNHDCLSMNLGLYGWIEMESPTIIEGTYDINVSFYSIAASEEYGRFMTILDGEYIGSEITTHGLSNSKTQIVTKTIGQVTFDGTQTHTLRILAGDDEPFYIDYIEFEPVPIIDETDPETGGVTPKMGVSEQAALPD
jgi:uncharacterized surface protein with fasciclin (FAS1) repeats